MQAPDQLVARQLGQRGAAPLALEIIARLTRGEMRGAGMEDGVVQIERRVIDAQGPLSPE